MRRDEIKKWKRRIQRRLISSKNSLELPCLLFTALAIRIAGVSRAGSTVESGEYAAADSPAQLPTKGGDTLENVTSGRSVHLHSTTDGEKNTLDERTLAPEIFLMFSLLYLFSHMVT